MKKKIEKNVWIRDWVSELFSGWVIKDRTDSLMSFYYKKILWIRIQIHVLQENRSGSHTISVPLGADSDLLKIVEPG